MAYSVDKIKDEADRTLEIYKDRPGRMPAKQLNIQHMRNYIRKVLFLCREVKRLSKKLEKSQALKEPK